MNNIIVKHMHDKKGSYVATFVAVPNEELVSIGWSKCHRIDLEKNRVQKVSSKKLGTQIAIDRACTISKVEVPKSLKSSMDKFIRRVSRYYKNKIITKPAGL